VKGERGRGPSATTHGRIAALIACAARGLTTVDGGWDAAIAVRLDMVSAMSLRSTGVGSPAGRLSQASLERQSCRSRSLIFQGHFAWCVEYQDIPGYNYGGGGSTSIAAGKARRSSRSLRRVVGQPRPACGAVAVLAVLLLGPALPLAAAGVHPRQVFCRMVLFEVYCRWRGG
jgi:hypothetical protein